MVQVSTSSALRYAYLHGFASSPLASKGVHLHRWFQEVLNLSLDRPDLNVPSFREQTLTKIVDHVEQKIINSGSVWSFIGSSFGGLVSTLVAQRQPNTIHSILLLAPAFDSAQIWMKNMNIEQWKRDGFLNHYNMKTQREEPINYDFFSDLLTYPAYPLVTTCPITIIHGLHDDVVPISSSREYFRRLEQITKHPTKLIELVDDHYLKKTETLKIIEMILLKNHQ